MPLPLALGVSDSSRAKDATTATALCAHAELEGLPRELVMAALQELEARGKARRARPLPAPLGQPRPCRVSQRRVLGTRHLLSVCHCASARRPPEHPSNGCRLVAFLMLEVLSRVDVEHS